jgi:predicted phosphodiesterase
MGHHVGYPTVVSRREFLKVSLGGLIAGQISCAPQAISTAGDGKLRFGILADVHYADTQTRGTRYYRHSLEKLSECVAAMNDRKVDFLVELGDLKDQDLPAVEQKTLSYLKTAEKILRKFAGPTYHVLGNHDMDSISKKQFLSYVENTNIEPSRSYYSFDFKEVHFIVLDANFRSDGADYDHGNFDWQDANIPGAETEWLKKDLADATGAAIVLIHQPLAGTEYEYVNNAAEVRGILEESNKVLAVLQGHHHPGDYIEKNGICYYTLRAMVEGPGAENNSYAIVEPQWDTPRGVEISRDRSITITGYHRTVSKQILCAHTETRIL